MKRYIYLVECDFCYDKVTDLYFVDVIGNPETYTCCMNCIIKKGWNE